jgi:hypothetical protein
MEAFYAESITINQSFWGEADTDTRFEVGDQSLWTDLYGNLPANRRRQFSFNRIRRVINMIEGHQRRNRKSTTCVPVENASEETADQLTKILMWCNNTEGILETISESFKGALVTGMNLLQVWVDYRSDPVSGNIKVDNCPYNAFLIDPYFRKADLSDCNAIWKRSFLTKRECISLLPAHTEEILGLINSDTGVSRDAKFQFTPESYNYGYKNLLTYDEFYYRDYRTKKILIDTQTGEVTEWTGDDERLHIYLREFPTITIQETEVPTVNLAIVVQGKVMYHGPNPLGIDQYPFVPVFAYYNPQMPYFPFRIQGVVRGLRDAQYLYNRRRIIELDILESQINSGWVYKEEALVNPGDVFLSGQGRGLALKRGSSIAESVQKIPSASIDPSMIQLSELLAKEIQEVAGVSDELLGFDNKETLSGYHAMLKMSSSTTTLQPLFDNLDRAQKLLGALMIQIIQNNFTPGKVQKIIHEQPTSEFYNKLFGRYDAVVEEGLNTSTQRQLQFGQMLQLREAGVPIGTADLLEAATLQGKKKIIENAVQQEQQAAQAQQAQAQFAMQEQQARTDLAHARAEADRGLGVERLSRVEENQALAVERRAEAQADQEQALLNFVKALKEIEEIDINHLERLITLSHVVKDRETMVNQSEQTKTDTVSKAMSALGQVRGQPLATPPGGLQ